MTDLERILNDAGVPPEQLSQFRRYFELLVERNRVMNLTAITDEADVARLHFLDSLALAPLLRAAEATAPVSLIDVGSGAGFPGLPLAIAFPQARFTLLDGTQKRVDFLKDVAAELKLSNVTAICGRAEELCSAKQSTENVSRETFSTSNSREVFEIATARAVARLSELCELCLPFVKVGGAFIAMKSTDTDEEIAAAAHAITALGGTLEEVRDYTVADVRRRLVIVRKLEPTAAQYPRRYAKIQKQPL